MTEESEVPALRNKCEENNKNSSDSIAEESDTNMSVNETCAAPSHLPEGRRGKKSRHTESLLLAITRLLEASK